VGRLAKLLALPRGEKTLLLVSAVALPAVAAGIAILGFKRTQAVAARWATPLLRRRLSGEAETARAVAVSRVVAIAAGSGPVRATCLPRSLWIWALLRREGIETVLRVGVNRDDGTLHAHAWVEHLGLPLIDAADIASRFPAFEQDFGATAAGGS
jgi:hypothetical protein